MSAASFSEKMATITDRRYRLGWRFGQAERE